MEVGYKRRFNQSYMILKWEESEQETYELAVLAHNKIPGFLSVETEISDGKLCFWYEITGKQTLKDYFTRLLADYKLLYLLFEGIRQVLETVDNYLLEEKNILLQEEFIYIDFAQEKISFAYLPGWQQEGRVAFRELMETILQRLDHSDKLATAIAYEMYQWSLGQEEAFSNMWKKSLKKPSLELDREQQRDALLTLSQEEWEKEKPVSERETESGIETELYEETEQQKHLKLYKENEIYKKFKEFKKKKSLDNMRKNTGWMKKGIKLKERQEEPFVTQYQEVVSHPTELLTGNRGIQGVLLYQGMGAQSSLYVDKAIFTIGKQEDEVDGYIDAKSVSRVHARIEIEDGDYYIEDLNSTNGTYLNGEPLEYHQKVKLQLRDRVTFGMEEFIFM